jgi:hypothetical protein
MKRYFFYAVLALAAFSLLAPAVVQAQIHNRLIGKVPFDFNVGKTSMPAGVYTIKPESNSILHIWNHESGKSVLVLTNSGETCDSLDRTEGHLIFTKYGDQYFLSQVANPNLGVKLNLPKSRAEKEAANQAAKPNATAVALKTH